MPFIALCPHCRNAKVSAPTRKRGQPHTCPKCNSEFPLEPLDESNLPVDYKLPPPEFDILKAYEEPAREDFASAPTMVASALTGSAIVPVPDLKPKSTAVPATPAAPEIDYTPSASISSDLPFTFVLIALGVFGAGMLASQFPYGRFVALPFLIVGLILGFLALPGLGGREKYAWGAVAANGIGLLFVLLLPSWLGLSTWLPPGNPDAGPKPVLAVSKTLGTREPAEWVDAYKAVWEQGDVRFEIVTAALGPADATQKAPMPGAPAPRAVLRFNMKISNVGVMRSLPFTGWQTTPEAMPKLTDNAGQAVTFLKTESPPPGPVLPGKDAEIVLVFEPPSKGISELSLELVPTAFEGTDAVKFKIPVAMIGGMQPPRKN